MNNKSKSEAERRARLLRMRADKLKDIKQRFEENQNRNFNSNFKPGGKDAKKTGNKTSKQSKNTKKQAENKKTDKNKINLSVSTKKAEMLRHQRLLSQDVNMQATQHIIGIPVNKSRYNGYKGEQVSNTKLRAAKPDPESVRVIPIGGLGEFGIGKNMTIIEYKDEAVIVDMGTLFAGEDYRTRLYR